MEPLTEILSRQALSAPTNVPLHIESGDLSGFIGYGALLIRIGTEE
jgi:hypothetical protein